MLNTMLPRRRFLGAAGAASGTLFPAMLRAQPAGLPNLTIKEVKVYVTASGHLASITTEGGVEGICTLQTSVFHANWDNSGWLN